MLLALERGGSDLIFASCGGWLECDFAGGGVRLECDFAGGGDRLKCDFISAETDASNVGLPA